MSTNHFGTMVIIIIIQFPYRRRGNVLKKNRKIINETYFKCRCKHTNTLHRRHGLWHDMKFIGWNFVSYALNNPKRNAKKRMFFVAGFLFMGYFYNFSEYFILIYYNSTSSFYLTDSDKSHTENSNWRPSK